MDNIKLLITDLDNTLYDWFVPWYKSYNLFINDVIEKTGVEKEQLLEQIKEIHQLRGTSEYSFDFLLNELDIIQNFYPKDEIENLKHKFYKTKKEYLKLYPGVMETLLILKERGCIIVAYTESMSFYANDRIRKLGLDGVIDKLYSPKEHSIPTGFTAYYDKEYYKLKKTEHIFLPLHHKKPSSEILNEIISTYDFKLDEIVYIGDSLTKDIKMAKDVKIRDVYAKYGSSNHKTEYALLKKVTHWSLDEVEKEKETTDDDIVPSYILEGSFSELLTKFKFGNFNEKEIEHLLKLWDRTIDVQKHFNDLAFRIKQFAVSISSLILGGLFALIASGKIPSIIDVGNKEVGTIPLAFYSAAFIWAIFYFVDRYWYHPLLKGAVSEGLKIERLISSYLPVKGLTTSIGDSSPIKSFGLTINSNKKIDIFYGLIVGLLIISGCFFYSSNNKTQNENEVNQSSLKKEAKNTIQENIGIENKLISNNRKNAEIGSNINALSLTNKNQLAVNRNEIILSNSNSRPKQVYKHYKDLEVQFNKSSIELTEKFKNYIGSELNELDKGKQYLLIIKGYSSFERLSSTNTFSDNFQLAEARAKSLKIFIMNKLIIFGYNLENFKFNTNAYSNASFNERNKDYVSQRMCKVKIFRTT